MPRAVDGQVTMSDESLKPEVNIMGEANAVGHNIITQLVKAEGSSTISGVTQVSNKRL